MQEQPYISLEKHHQYNQSCHTIHTCLDLIETHSPYLSRLAQKHPELIDQLVNSEHAKMKEQIESLAQDIIVATSFINEGAALPKEEELKRHLRIQKTKIALILAIAEIGNILHVSETTRYISLFAEKATQQALAYSLLASQARKTITFASVETSGVFILGMGKLGAHDLNYSSDIDIIILYDPEHMEYKGNKSLQDAMNEISRTVVNIMHERTPDGYVFRTDLRLRPDPASTPPAITIRAATNYYETVGQNWERAAMTKARIIAGDDKTGHAFLNAIHPFMWRRSLDFSAISDILSIKRQMNQGDADDIQLEEHNVKTGYGGIREIEFLAQLHQLIWGGRQRELQIKNTVQIINSLVQLSHLDKGDAEILCQDYFFLRLVEHRLQMIDDQQTHILPNDAEGLKELADFMHYSDAETFKKILLATLQRVHKSYTDAFDDESPLSNKDYGNLVFTGVEHDAPTLKTLSNMGFKQPHIVSTAIQDWHKGNRRCTRSSRPRTLLTELTPQILLALSNTINPDDAFKRFDNFLIALPVGVQIFSLFISNPELITLIARIMGSAPALGDALSREPYLLEAVLTGDFYGELQTYDELSHQLESELQYLSSEESKINAIHRFKREKEFQSGIQLLDSMITVEKTGEFLTNIADIALKQVFIMVQSSFQERYGAINGTELVVIALGKMGSHELTYASDIDLIFTYIVADDSPNMSDGEKSLDISTYYNRLVQRYVGILTAQTKHGILYDIDTRLRPFGKDSALAINYEAFDNYYQNTAWVFERLALNRARIIISSKDKLVPLSQDIVNYIAHPLPHEYIAQAIKDMRIRIAASHADAKNPWNIKHHQGGLMDVDFIIQYLTMCHAADCPEIMGTNNAYERLHSLVSDKLITTKQYNTLCEARTFLTSLLFYLRLCGSGSISESDAPQGLKDILTKAHDMKDFDALKQRLLECEENIAKLCDSFQF